MKTISTANIKSDVVVVKTHFTIHADPLETAFVSGLFCSCELSWVAPSPRFFDARYIAPRDFSLGETVTEDSIMTFEELCVQKASVGRDFFSCVCALDNDDIERISLFHSSPDETESRIGLYINGGRHADAQLDLWCHSTVY